MNDEITPSEYAVKRQAFLRDLAHVINCHSMENGSDTPDWLLAEHLLGCLNNFAMTTRLREKWYGRERDPLVVAGSDAARLPAREE